MDLPCSSVGTIIVTDRDPDHPDPKVHVAVDEQIVAYARSLVPPSVELNRTRYAPHITTIRGEWVEVWDLVKPFHGHEVTFRYDPRVVAGRVYWWLRVWSDDLVSLRRSVGLPDLGWSCRPPDDEPVFHITIGNLKGQV